MSRRFAYYGMRTVLVLYFSHFYLWSNNQSIIMFASRNSAYQ